MPLRIAILGTRGIPANYGGFETFAQELSWRLAKRGHEVTVYGRRHYVPAGLREYRGVRVLSRPSFRTKHLETLSNSAVCAADSLVRGFDAVLICNAANALLAWVPRLVGSRVILNVDGIERKRRKWGLAGREFYRVSEWLAFHLSNRIVTDAREIQAYYASRFGVDSTFIPYGAPVGPVQTDDTPKRLGLASGNFLLYVSRLEPENNAHRVIGAALRSKVDPRLVVVGDAPYARTYVARLKQQIEGSTVLMPGAIYGTGYFELLANCLLYFHGTEVGGTHPALLEAMGAGCICVVHDTPENREVADACALFCDFHDEAALAEQIRLVVECPERFRELRENAMRRVREAYDWERVTDQYEALFHELVA